jgi:hypothetical protein
VGIGAKSMGFGDGPADGAPLQMEMAAMVKAPAFAVYEYLSSAMMAS